MLSLNTQLIQQGKTAEQKTFSNKTEVELRVSDESQTKVPNDFMMKVNQSSKTETKLPISDEKSLTVESKVDQQELIELSSDRLSADIAKENNTLIKRTTIEQISKEQTGGEIADKVTNETNTMNSLEQITASSMIQPTIKTENKKEEVSTQSSRPAILENEYLSHDNLIYRSNIVGHADSVKLRKDKESESSNEFDES